MKERTLVTNASPVIHLARMESLDILTRIYSNIYCSKRVKEEVMYPAEAVKFIEENTEVREVKNQAFVEDIQRKHSRLRRGEIETFVLYNEMNAGEALFLNNQAERIFNNEYGGQVRDIIELPKMDINKVVFKTEKDIDEFYLKLDKSVPNYKKLQEVLRIRGLVK
jgi:predicted nucleic acid-binding protein